MRYVASLMADELLPAHLATIFPGEPLFELVSALRPNMALAYLSVFWPNPNQEGHGGLTLLSHVGAVLSQRPDEPVAPWLSLVETMLARGADPCHVDESFRTVMFDLVQVQRYNPITMACLAHVRASRNLVDVVLRPDEVNDTLVLYAIKSRNEPVLMACLECGVSFDTDVYPKLSFLCATAAFCDALLLEKLVVAHASLYPGVAIQLTPKLLGRALFVAVVDGRAKEIPKLVDLGATVSPALLLNLLTHLHAVSYERPIANELLCLFGHVLGLSAKIPIRSRARGSRRESRSGDLDSLMSESHDVAFVVARANLFRRGLLLACINEDS